MKKLTKEERNHIYKMNETVLSDIGYEHVNNICEETDQLLKKYKDIEVPKSLDEWFRTYKIKNDRKIKFMKFRKSALLVSKRVAMFLIAVVIITLTLTISVEAFRLKFFNIFVETNAKYSFVKTDENIKVDYLDKIPKEWSSFYYPRLLPEGYKFLKAIEVNNAKYIFFNNAENKEICFIQDSMNSESQLDSEEGLIIEVDINGMEGIIILKDESNIINWHNNNQNFYIQGNVEKSILLKIEESILKK
ncbi:MAG: DUF4367 domain-containing protein [Bacillota bacterium]|nr:DUF4367 domain-containing protein [Bacillota bacterium]